MEAARAILWSRWAEPQDAALPMASAWTDFLMASAPQPPPRDGGQATLLAHWLGPQPSGTARTLAHEVERTWAAAAALECGHLPNTSSRAQLRKSLAVLGQALRQQPAPTPLRLKALRVPAAVLGVLAALGALTVRLARAPGEHSFGWDGQYFANAELAGVPVRQQDGQVAFFWDEGPPLAGLPADHFSVRWDGCLMLEDATRVEFQLGSDDGSRLLVDGPVLINHWDPHTMAFKGANVLLGRGAHHLRVEFYDHVRTATLVLKVGFNGAPPALLGPRAVVFPFGSNPDAPCQEATPP